MCRPGFEPQAVSRTAPRIPISKPLICVGLELNLRLLAGQPLEYRYLNHLLCRVVLHLNRTAFRMPISKPLVCVGLDLNLRLSALGADSWKCRSLRWKSTLLSFCPRQVLWWPYGELNHDHLLWFPDGVDSPCQCGTPWRWYSLRLLRKSPSGRRRRRETGVAVDQVQDQAGRPCEHGQLFRRSAVWRGTLTCRVCGVDKTVQYSIVDDCDVSGVDDGGVNDDDAGSDGVEEEDEDLEDDHDEDDDGTFYSPPLPAANPSSSCKEQIICLTLKRKFF